MIFSIFVYHPLPALLSWQRCASSPKITRRRKFKILISVRSVPSTRDPRVGKYLDGFWVSDLYRDQSSCTAVFWYWPFGPSWDMDNRFPASFFDQHPGAYTGFGESRKRIFAGKLKGVLREERAVDLRSGSFRDEETGIVTNVNWNTKNSFYGRVGFAFNRKPLRLEVFESLYVTKIFAIGLIDARSNRNLFLLKFLQRFFLKLRLHPKFVDSARI